MSESVSGDMYDAYKVENRNVSQGPWTREDDTRWWAVWKSKERPAPQRPERAGVDAARFLDRFRFVNVDSTVAAAKAILAAA